MACEALTDAHSVAALLTYDRAMMVLAVLHDRVSEVRRDHADVPRLLAVMRSLCRRFTLKLPSTHSNLGLCVRVRVCCPMRVRVLFHACVCVVPCV